MESRAPNAAHRASLQPDRPPSRLSSLAQRVRDLSLGSWGESHAVELVGLSETFCRALDRVRKAACYTEPLLITGESGTGKELLAQAVYLLSDLRGKPYVPVNCPQYLDGNLTVSELFGHERGSFTGATEKRRGAFREADGGVIFLDEIADLHPTAQAMLLRALACGEFRPMGASRSWRVSVRVIAATNRPLAKLTLGRGFREDLLFRLRYFLVEVPPLRERGDDWRLILEHRLEQLRDQHGVRKHFAADSLRMIADCGWPGNVRQLLGVVTMGYAMADGTKIRPRDLEGQLEVTPLLHREASSELWEQVSSGRVDFWGSVHARYMNRDLNRRQLRAFVKHGLQRNGWNYRALIEDLRIPPKQYQKFMDFLRHHDLKPDAPFGR